MKIGNLEIKGYAALAPMAGVADRAMREICLSHGAAYSVGELVSAKGISLCDKKSLEYLYRPSGDFPSAIQLFGYEPEIMAVAAIKAQESNPDFIDINMGCPAPKVAGNGGGSALMGDIRLAEKIVKAVVDVSKVPVTVKMRTGLDENSLNAAELAKACEFAGCSALTVHGRTKKQMYAPPVNTDMIRKVKQSVKIPIIGNGDVKDGKSAKEMYEKTGCDFVMVGRAACGNPFVFDEINAFFENVEYYPPRLEEKLKVLIEQIKLMQKYRSKKVAMLEARKHTAWYLSGIKGAAALRRECGTISSIEDVRLICEKALEYNKDL
ncbi:MAG: tRNA dihydrouridine synthase DusB [Clostridia bacterium]|nr:tRNA dihydrouridine synthase DusB [Clostridia bacterium]